MPGTSTTTVTSASAAISISSCPTPTVSMMTKSKPGGAEEAGERGAGARQSAGCAARRHGPDEDAGIRVVALHPHTVAEYRAARARLEGSTAMIATVFPRRRISAVSASTSELLPAPGGPVTPTISPSPSGADARNSRASGAPFSTCVARRASSRVVNHQSFSNWRAITRRWISLVPSPIVQSFTSR